MRIKKLNKSNEESFLAYIEGMEHEFFFLLMDYKLNPEDNHLFMALDENHKVHGLFQVLFGQIQLRGSKEAVEAFLGYLKENDIEVQELSAKTIHQALLNLYFTSPKTIINKYRMIYTEEDQNPSPQYEYQRLEGNDKNKEKIASLIRNADPKHWGKVQSKYLVMDEMRPYFGIKGSNEEILSLAGLWFDDKVGLINVIATHPKSRKKGYATSILTSSIDWLLQRTNKIIIDVRTDYTAAIRIYQKLGFEIGFEFLVLTIDG